MRKEKSFDGRFGLASCLEGAPPLLHALALDRLLLFPARQQAKLKARLPDGYFERYQLLLAEEREKRKGRKGNQAREMRKQEAKKEEKDLLGFSEREQGMSLKTGEKARCLVCGLTGCAVSCPPKSPNVLPLRQFHVHGEYLSKTSSPHFSTRNPSGKRKTQERKDDEKKEKSKTSTEPRKKENKKICLGKQKRKTEKK